MPSGFKTFAVSEVLTAADVNNYLMEQAVAVFANATARDSAISSPEDGQACFFLDTSTLQFYYSSAWNDFVGSGDITAVNTNANSGLSGGTASGAATLLVDPSNLADGSSVTVDTANDLLILEDVTDGTVYKVKPNQIASGSANALVDGDSDFTITDGVANGIHYELDNTDMADWNQTGINLTTNGGLYRHNQTQAVTMTIASGEGAVLAGPVSVTGTITVTGTMVVI